jgi:hypothetical protein
VQTSTRCGLLASVTLLALAAAARPAAACTCDGAPVVLSPQPAATGVPRNVRLALYYFFPDYGGPALALRELGTGVEIPLTIEAVLHGSLIVFAQPDELLAAGAEYEIIVPPSLFHERVTTFTVGDTLDESPPAFAGLAALAAHTYQFPNPDGCFLGCISGGDRLSRLELTYDLPGADTAFLMLEVRHHDDLGPSHLVPFPWGPQEYVEGMDCWPAIPRLEPGETYCARLLAYDAAGNVAGADAEVCAVARSCANIPDEHCIPERGCRREGGCAAAPGSRAAGSGAALVALAGVVLLAARRRSGRACWTRRLGACTALPSAAAAICGRSRAYVLARCGYVFQYAPLRAPGVRPTSPRISPILATTPMRYRLLGPAAAAPYGAPLDRDTGVLVSGRARKGAGRGRARGAAVRARMLHRGQER